MAAKISQSVRESQLNYLPGVKFVRWVDGYQNSRSKAIMRCEHGHEWSANCDKLLNKGTGCPTCAGVYRYSRVERERQLGELSGVNFVRWDSVYENCSSRAVVSCGKNHERAATINDLINNGSRCPTCAGKRHYSAIEREQQLNSKPGVHFVRWFEVYKNKNSKSVVRCKNGHEWVATIDSLLNAGSGCPKCAGQYRYDPKERELQLNQLNGKRFIRWADTRRSNKRKAVMKCEVDGYEWTSSVNSLLKGTGCPVCAKTGFDPTKPAALYALMHENGGHIKIGISNRHKRRIAELRYGTPFAFSVISSTSGLGHEIRGLEKMFHANFESSGFSDFDGATEWLKFDPDILSLLRILGA